MNLYNWRGEYLLTRISKLQYSLEGYEGDFLYIEVVTTYQINGLYDIRITNEM